MTPEWTPDAVGLHRWRGKARRRAAGLRRRLQAHHPEVSLVVVLDGPVAPARDVLASACAQSGPRLEVVAVVADPRLLALAEAVADRDERVRLVEVPGSDRARARTMGAVAATAPWLLFLAPGTELLPGAVAALAQARGEGSWAVLGGLERRGPVPGEAPPAWARTPLLARVLVDRDAWARCLDDAEPDGQTAATAVLSLGHAAVATSVVRDLAGRGADTDSWTSTSADPWAELSARVARDRAGLALLERPDQLRDRRLRAAGAMERDLPRVLAAAELLPDRGWALLHHHAAELLEVAGDELATVPAAVRAAAGLAADDRRDDLVALVVRLRADAGEPPTRVEDGAVLAVTGGPALSEAETGVDAEVREQAEAAGVLEVRVRAGLRRVEAGSPDAQVRLVGTGGEELGDLEVLRGAPDLVVRVPTERLGEARWHVEVTLGDRGVRRTGTARGTVAREPVRRETVRPPEPDAWHRALGDEADPSRQRRLRQQVRDGSPAVDPALLLLDAGDAGGGGGRGEGTGDVLAVGLELARRLPDARVRWVVADPAAAVPAGAEPVVRRSAAWHAALATAAWVVTDRADVVGPLPDGRDDLEDWFVPRPGQQVVFTGAGHPSRAAGLPRWRRRGYVPSHVAQLLAVTSARWTTALVPVPELEQPLRDSWAYDGPVVAAGAPRLDAVLAPDRDDHRRAVRERLGVQEQQVAVLWATTCRDDVTGECLSASGGPGPDPARVARELGPDHVLLLLGPRCARHAAAGPGVHLVDLATHPELALDLAGVVLASDVGVLDWSPLRFDLAAAGRPVLLWVPDLDDHVETDGLAFDLGRSTAGPLVRTTEEVLRALADPAGLRRTWDDRRRELVGFFDRLDDGRATARVVDALLAPGPGGPA